MSEINYSYNILMEAEVLKTFLEHCIRNKRQVSIKTETSTHCGTITQYDDEVIELCDSNECSVIVFVKKVSVIEEINEGKEEVKPSAEGLGKWFKIQKQIPPQKVFDDYPGITAPGPYYTAKQITTTDSTDSADPAF